MKLKVYHGIKNYDYEYGVKVYHGIKNYDYECGVASVSFSNNSIYY